SAASPAPSRNASTGSTGHWRTGPTSIRSSRSCARQTPNPRSGTRANSTRRWRHLPSSSWVVAPGPRRPRRRPPPPPAPASPATPHPPPPPPTAPSNTADRSSNVVSGQRQVVVVVVVQDWQSRRLRGRDDQQVSRLDPTVVPGRGQLGLHLPGPAYR